MQNKKRILNVRIKRMIDESPDTSWLGEYANNPTSEYSIDRLHSADCKLRDYTDNPDDECTCNERGDMERHEYRYFNPGSVEKFNPDNQWLAKYPAQERKDVWQKTMRQNAKSDYERMESLNRGDFCFIGIRAIADIALPLDRTYTLQTALGTRKEIATATQHITSGGLWGIESDSDREYLESVEKEELSDLRTQLRALGFSTRAISTAFKTVERTEE